MSSSNHGPKGQDGNGRSRPNNQNGSGSGSGSGRGGAVPITFTEEDFQYSVEEFLCPGQDDRGTSHRLHFRVTPVTERALEVLRDSKRFPYKTVSDIVRHAVARHVAWLHQLETTIPKHFLAGLTAVDEVVRDSEIMTAVSETFRKLDANIQAHQSVGDDAEAIRVLSMARSQIAKIPDCRWKRNFLIQFSTKYAALLSGGIGKPSTTTTTNLSDSFSVSDLDEGTTADNVVAIRHG